MIHNSNIAIELKNVSKIYEIHHEKPTLVEKFINSSPVSFVALKNINLKIRKGEKIGIIGPNGSGKTTLLKLIAGITSATVGNVKSYGRVVSLIDLEAGFHPELTGEQNIYLNGMIMGMKKDEITKQFRKIIDFSGIDKFLDIPLFTYSEGMKLKLGFSIAVHASPDILILDESMWAGDMEFQNKSSARLKDFFKMKKTILVVSHWLPYIKDNCDRVIYLEKGKIAKDGTKKIIEYYKKRHNR
jgi:ABC-type polysaccharide/polyol phosphate transport system ATPase subunit